MIEELVKTTREEVAIKLGIELGDDDSIEELMKTMREERAIELGIELGGDDDTGEDLEGYYCGQLVEADRG